MSWSPVIISEGHLAHSYHLDTVLSCIMILPYLSRRCLTRWDIGSGISKCRQVLRPNSTAFGLLSMVPFGKMALGSSSQE